MLWFYVPFLAEIQNRICEPDFLRRFAAYTLQMFGGA
jgi:hypothetical protein